MKRNMFDFVGGASEHWQVVKINREIGDHPEKGLKYLTAITRRLCHYRDMINFFIRVICSSNTCETYFV